MLGIVAWPLAVLLLYAPVFKRLGEQWRDDPNYTHGPFVLLVAVWLAMQQRERLRYAPRNPSNAGLLLVGASLALFVAGTLGAELFITRLSFIGVAAGAVLFLFGPAHFKLLSFPLGFLLLAIPLPAIVFDRVSVTLQLVSSDLGASLLRAVGTPVLRDGNILMLPTVTLEVANACSGIRSLVALVAVTTLLAHLVEPIGWIRAVLAVSAVVVAIVMNAVRIAITGVAAGLLGTWVTRGWVHDAWGWLTFVLSLGILLGIRWVARWSTSQIEHPLMETA